MTREQFARALAQGLGRPILYAHEHGAALFADLIVQACLYNRVYDRQTDVGRAPYLAELLAATGDEGTFRLPILAALADPDAEMDEELLFDLALHFARDGDAKARQTMLARFLDNVSNGDVTGASQIADLDSPAGLRFAVEQIGAALGRAVDFGDCWLPDYLLGDLETAFADQPGILSDPRVSAFRAAALGSADEQAARKQEHEHRRQLRARLEGLSYSELKTALEAKLLSVTSLSRWGKRADDAELRHAADDLLAAPDVKQQERLLLIFDQRDFPDGYEPLLPFLDAPDRLLRLRAANAISRFRHPDLRARAIGLLAHVDTLEYGLALLAGNDAPGDYAMLVARLQELLDDEALHAFGWRIHDMFARNPAAEAAELLLSLYEQGPCAQCREKFVADLIALDALPPHLAQECRFDANEGVRALVAPLGG